MPVLILDQPGSTLGKDHDMLYVTVPPATRENVPLAHLESVVVADRVQITHDALMMLAERGIPAVFLRGNRPLAVFNPFAAHGMVLTRRAQILAYVDWRGAHLAKAFVRAGLENKARMLLHVNKYQGKKARQLDFVEDQDNGGNYGNIDEDIFEFDSDNDSEKSNIILRAVGRIRAQVTEVDALDERCAGSCADTVRGRLMGLEGEGASAYFGAVKALVPAWADFGGRNRRPPRDPFNTCLSYGYAVLESAVMCGIAAAGLEPYAGFLHADRSGKPSLSLDLIEEFRQVVVDRVALRLFRRKQLQEEHFDRDPGRVKFTEEGKRLFVGELYKEIRYGAAKPSKSAQVAKSGEPKTFLRAILKQSRKLARFLLGQEDAYKPYLWKW